MNKYLKKFGIMFVMTLILTLGFCVSAFADDNGAVGTNNLNNTVNNSAKVGDQLKAPEVGWKRYDDRDSRFVYSSDVSWIYDTTLSDCGGAYLSTSSYTNSGVTGGSVTFKFYGTKIRLIESAGSVFGTDSGITIDGVKETYTKHYSSAGKTTRQYLLYEKSGLSLGVHSVTLTSSSNGTWNLDNDAIDIDNIGYLVDPNESISLDQSSMNLNVGDSQQLTATTTPAGAQVTWTSSDSSMATVDSNGNVTGIKEGICTITATNPDGLTATCAVNVTPKDTTTPTEPTGDANLYIELVDGQIKQYTVSSDEINKFTTWYENRDKDHSLAATYKFAKGTYTDYVVHDQIDWFEVR